MVRIKSSQKIFTADEVVSLTGICMDELQKLARSKHLGFIARAAEAAGQKAGELFFTASDLMIVVLLYSRSE